MEQQDRIMDGDLQTLGLQSILKMLALSGKTGTLFVHSGPETLSISLRRGQIVSLREEGVPQPDLLVMLCLINKLDPPRVQAIREHAGDNTQVALSLLVERGWMSVTEMQRRLEFAITQSISHALRWVNGRFAFHRQLLTIENKINPLDIDSVLLEALRQADEWEEMGETHLARTSVPRWLPEVNNDVRSLGLSQEAVEVLCLSNGELSLQAISLVLMTPEARVARIMLRLLEFRLIEVVDTALETELQQDLSNLIIRCQSSLARQRNSSNPEQHLLGLVAILSECINGLLSHHGTYAKSLRGRGQIPLREIVRYLERRFGQQLQLLASQQYPILETVEFANGKLDCTSILTLKELVKGEKLEEFYWDAVLGLAAFLRMVFAEILRDEVGNSHTGRHLNMVWKAFLTEIDFEIQQYQLYRAQRNSQLNYGGEASPSLAVGMRPNWNNISGNDGDPYGPSEPRRRSI